MNVGFGVSISGFKIGASFSDEKQSVKANVVNYSSKTTRVSFRNRMYAVHLDSSAELHPNFKSKIYEIAASIQNNDTGLAQYLAVSCRTDRPRLWYTLYHICRGWSSSYKVRFYLRRLFS